MYSDFCHIFGLKDRMRFVLLLVLMVIGSFVELVTLGTVPLYISALLNGLPDYLAKYCSAEKFPMYGSLALLGMFIFRTLYFMMMFIVQERILRNRQLALGSRIFKAYLAAPYALVRHSNSSVVVNNVSAETERLICSFLDPLMNLIRNTIVAFAVLVLLLAFDSLVSVSAFAVLALAGGAFMALSHHRMTKYGDIAHNARETSVKIVSEGVGVFKEAAILGCAEHFSTTLHRVLEKQAKAMRAVYGTQKCLWPSMELLTVAVLVGTFAILLYCGRTPQAIAPTLALLTVSLARLKGSVTEILLFFNMIRYNSSSVTAIAGELRRLEGAVEPGSNVNAKPIVFQNAIKVSNVSFSYPDGDKPVLNDVSFEIQKGASVGFVGTTGSGKTTMVELILGLFRPTAGKITVDGVDISDNMSSWQRQLGFVPQDIFLLDDTIRANVALGIAPEEINEAAVARALKAAQLEDFVSSLPKGDLSIVGEHGTLLSGGQRQRIGIARALYRNPQIIVFDEATSALDNETEAAVVSAIEALRGEHTLIIVAHRLTTIANCSQVIDFSSPNKQK